MTFKPLGLSELLSMPPESAEQAYRRGYRDGYIAALQNVYGNRSIPQRHWSFWRDDLFAWVRAAQDNFRLQFPPKFDLRKKGGEQ